MKNYRFEVHYIDTEGNEVIQMRCNDLNRAHDTAEWTTYATRFEAWVIDTWKTKTNSEKEIQFND